MGNSRRQFLRNSLLLSGAAGLNLPAGFGRENQHNADGDRLVLLGTQGGPFIRSYQQTPSGSVIVYKSIPFIIDTGYGTTFKLKEAGIDLATIRYICITHLHSDHYLDLGPLLYNAWIAGLAEKIQVYGPQGIQLLLHAYWQSNEYDISLRIKDEGRPDIRKLVEVQEIKEGVLLSNTDVEITCLKNNHPPVEESYAFKFRVGEKSIVFSGDTAYFPPLAAFAKNADYLVHEVMYTPAVDAMAKRRPNAAKLVASIKAHHTAAEDVGKIARDANVKHLVLNHFVPPDDKSLADNTWIDTVRTNFTGDITVGKDLLQIKL